MENFNEIAEITIQYKKKKTAKQTKISSSATAYDVFKSVFADNIEYKELFYIMLLDNGYNVLGVSRISEGGITGTLVDVRIVFQTVLKAHATAIVLCHNHPSGKLSPSEPDKNLTKKIKRGADFLDIKLVDHLIITEQSFFSFADERLL